MTPLLTIFYIFLLSLFGIVTLFWFQTPRDIVPEKTKPRKSFWFIFDVRGVFRGIKDQGVFFMKRILSKILLMVSRKVKQMGSSVSETLKKKAQKIDSTR